MPSRLFAYLGPESLLPLTSVVATVAGVFLMLGSNTLRIIRRAARSLLRRTVRTRPVPQPHFPAAREEPLAPSPGAEEAARPQDGVRDR